MKKTVLTLTLVIITFIANAQYIGKGRVMLGLGFNTNSSSQELQQPIANTGMTINSYKYTSYNTNLRYGYFITDHIMVGIFGGYNNNKTTQSLTQTTNGFPNLITKQVDQGGSYYGGLFSRYYQMLGKSNFALYGQLSTDYGAGKTKSVYINGYSPDVNTQTKINSVNVRLNPGIVYFVNKVLAVEASFGNVGYGWQKSEERNGNIAVRTIKSSGFNSSLNFSLSSLFLGVNFYFGRVNEPSPPKG